MIVTDREKNGKGYSKPFTILNTLGHLKVYHIFPVNILLEISPRFERILQIFLLFHYPIRRTFKEMIRGIKQNNETKTNDDDNDEIKQQRTMAATNDDDDDKKMQAEHRYLLRVKKMAVLVDRSLMSGVVRPSVSIVYYRRKNAFWVRWGTTSRRESFRHERWKLVFNFYAVRVKYVPKFKRASWRSAILVQRHRYIRTFIECACYVKIDGPP